MMTSMTTKNVFLIAVDCLRADHMGCIGKGDLTPNIDKLAEDALVFRTAFANGLRTNQSCMHAVVARATSFV